MAKQDEISMPYIQKLVALTWCKQEKTKVEFLTQGAKIYGAQHVITNEARLLDPISTKQVDKGFARK